MAIIEKSIVDWKNIMLDTSVILALFNSENPNTTDETILFTRELIDYLNSSNSGDGKPRKFIISIITLTEILTKENDQAKIQRIIKVLDSDNVEFVDFDIETSLMFNQQLYPYLSKPELHKMAAQFGFKTNDYMLAREWISRDFMIIMSGVANKSDVILTADYKTFYQLAHKCNAFCGLTYKNLWDKPFKSVTGYFHKKAIENYLVIEKEDSTNNVKANIKGVLEIDESIDKPVGYEQEEK